MKPNFCIVVGYPGSGKTYIMNDVIQNLDIDTIQENCPCINLSNHQRETFASEGNQKSLPTYKCVNESGLFNFNVNSNYLNTYVHICNYII